MGRRINADPLICCKARWHFVKVLAWHVGGALFVCLCSCCFVLTYATALLCSLYHPSVQRHLTSVVTHLFTCMNTVPLYDWLPSTGNSLATEHALAIPLFLHGSINRVILTLVRSRSFCGLLVVQICDPTAFCNILHQFAQHVYR